MKKYEFPKLEITVLTFEDVITTSGIPDYVEPDIIDNPGLESPIVGESNFK